MSTKKPQSFLNQVWAKIELLGFCLGEKANEHKKNSCDFCHKISFWRFITIEIFAFTDGSKNEQTLNIHRILCNQFFWWFNYCWFLGHAATGSYHVLLPDGRTQSVKYTADHPAGYIADVSYSGYA